MTDWELLIKKYPELRELVIGYGKDSEKAILFKEEALLIKGILDKHFVRTRECGKLLKLQENENILKGVDELMKFKKEVKDALKKLEQLKKQNENSNEYDRQRAIAFGDAINILKKGGLK